ncbi:MAG: DNA double-strand break repair nuclease NurA [Mojavia pulchra JT2-VF2]|jgi:hypothetical protein|uniref:DNA double-strand break repair nuclease NurA n=1 Tax=Mojavia pulchra JT2-VF2 TaxID=287848 RepID=A0A951UDI3_9NOST|nr:DNA double-strand break repair nuclease NurA [Mojavia pulchra JT2-VF2]
MNSQDDQYQSLAEEKLLEDLQRQPHIMIKLSENALLVADSLRDNYFKNTAKFITHLRGAMRQAARGERPDQILSVQAINDLNWEDVQGEVVTFIDGGLGQVQMSSPVPVLLRVGSYRVKTGERSVTEREHFGYYPIILGDLEGGSKERKDFPDIIRITSELLGGLSAVKRTPDLRVLMFHGPLVYMMSGYAGHTPFTEKDIDIFLHQYAEEPGLAEQLKEEFLREAEIEIYPKIAPDRSDEWIERRLFEPLSWIAFLYRQLIKEAQKRKPNIIIAGVVERGELREFSEFILLERIFQSLRQKGNQNYFNELYGRKDIKSPKALLDKLGYTDSLLLSMLLEPGQFSEPWEIKNKYAGLTKGKIALPGESYTSDVDWTCLKPPNKIGFPKVLGCYVKVSETTEPFRVEVFDKLGKSQIIEAARRAYLYASLLPGYGFPVGLDIADKYAKIPSWLTDAYSKLIKYHLGISLQSGQVSDAQMRRLIVQSIYMTKRDWLFRPSN